MTNKSVQLHAADETDLSYIVELENAPENRDFIMQWSIEEHRLNLQDKDKRYFVIYDPSSSRLVGFLILLNVNSTNHSILLKRLVIEHKNCGYGRLLFGILKKIVFTEYKAHRFWLECKDFNERAKHLYEEEGF